MERAELRMYHDVAESSILWEPPQPPLMITDLSTITIATSHH